MTVRLPLPVGDPEEIIAAVLEAVTPRTRLVLLDHVTSSTALVLPVPRLVHELASRGVEVMVDGAHAPGMLALDLDELGAAYYTGNGHKWLCGPKGAGFLHVRRDRQASVLPAVLSHGWSSHRPDRPRLHELFDWVGTDDYTPFLCLKSALAFLSGLYPNGMAELRERNHHLALEARQILVEELDGEPTGPATMIGSMATVLLPGSEEAAREARNCYSTDVLPWQRALSERYQVEAPVKLLTPTGREPCLGVRVSAQAYNSPEDYRRLVVGLRELGVSQAPGGSG